jgi:hypothetical protein
MTHKNAEDLAANILVGRSVKHRSTLTFARHHSYGRTATVDKIAQPIGKLKDSCQYQPHRVVRPPPRTNQLARTAPRRRTDRNKMSHLNADFIYPC